MVVTMPVLKPAVTAMKQHARGRPCWLSPQRLTARLRPRPFNLRVALRTPEHCLTVSVRKLAAFVLDLGEHAA